jgi:hypothetical protein
VTTPKILFLGGEKVVRLGVRILSLCLSFLMLSGFGMRVAKAGNVKIVHDAEYYILEAQNGKATDSSLDIRNKKTVSGLWPMGEFGIRRSQ